MTKHFFIFLGTFVAGALIALTVRAARFDGETTAAPVAHAAPAAAPAPAVADHTQAGHADHAAPPAAAAGPVNTVCAICGMEVDPDLPAATYAGKQVGFGCKACPPKFKANPDKYGPAALRNEVVR